MSEIAVRHTREECFAHTNDWKKPYDGSIFDMFKDGTFELIDLSNPFGRGNPLWPSNGDFHIDRVQHMPMHYRLLQTFNDFHMHNSTHADSPAHVIPESPFTHELPIQNYFGEAVCLDIPKGKWELITVEEYEEMFGHPAIEDFPEWEPCHDILMANNVMGIENLGGDLDKVTNQRFLFCAFPLRWYMGDGTIVRAVAFVPSDRIDRSVPDKEYPYGVY